MQNSLTKYYALCGGATKTTGLGGVYLGSFQLTTYDHNKKYHTDDLCDIPGGAALLNDPQVNFADYEHREAAKHTTVDASEREMWTDTQQHAPENENDIVNVTDQWYAKFHRKADPKAEAGFTIDYGDTGFGSE